MPGERTARGFFTRTNQIPGGPLSAAKNAGSWFLSLFLVLSMGTESRRLTGDIVFAPDPVLARRLADAWALIRAGVSIAFGRASVLRLEAE